MLPQTMKVLTGLALIGGAQCFTTPRAANRHLMTAFAAAGEAKTASAATRSDQLLDLINDQVTNELSASQLYLSASLWCERKDLCGMADYMRSESAEERSHAMGFLDYANKRDFPIELDELEAPNSSWDSVQDLWESLLRAEEINTHALLKLADAANEYGDHATTAFLMPYHTVRTYASKCTRG